jgi:hypothetical protein
MENNTKQIALSTEQMDHLKELGCDTSSASMYHYLIHYSYSFGGTVYGEWGLDLKSGEFPKNYQEISNNDDMEYAELKEVIPAFTLQDILELLEKTRYKNIGFPMIMMDYNIMNGFWYITLKNADGFKAPSYKEKSILDVAYKMLCWLLENKYIKF